MEKYLLTEQINRNSDIFQLCQKKLTILSLKNLTVFGQWEILVSQKKCFFSLTFETNNLIKTVFQWQNNHSEWTHFVSLK